MDSAFAVLRKGDQVVLLDPAYQDAALAILGLKGEAPPSDGAAEGRGRYVRYPLGEDRRGILKHYRHGGMTAGLFGDLFFGFRRPFREFLLSQRARKAGIPTSTLLAARVQAVFKLFYRGDVLLLEIPSALDAGALMKNPPPAGRERNRMLRAAAVAVRRMHDGGLLHADLNLKNLLLQPGEGEPAAYVVDLDLSSFRRGPLETAERAGNLLRLGRSFLKAGGDRLQASIPRRFLAAYTAGERPLRRRLRAQLRTYPLAYHLHRLGWRMRGHR